MPPPQPGRLLQQGFYMFESGLRPQPAKSVDSERKLYSLETLIALQRLLANGIPQGPASSEHLEMPAADEIPVDRSPPALISSTPTAARSAIALAGQIAQGLRALWWPFTALNRDRSPRRAGRPASGQ